MTVIYLLLSSLYGFALPRFAEIFTVEWTILIIVPHVFYLIGAHSK